MTTTRPALAPPGRDRSTSLAVVVESYLHQQFEAIAEGDVALHDGTDRIYPTRVAVRRTRSTLRSFGDLFETAARRQFDRELRWWAGLLGEVRDRSVQIAGINDLADRLGDSASVEPARAFVVEALELQREAALDVVLLELDAERHVELRAMIDRWVEPAFNDGAHRDGSAVRHYVDRARDRLEDALLEAGRPGATDVELHDARKAGKRYRYALELATPVLGDDAVRDLERARALQDGLGSYQDSVVGTAVLAELSLEQTAPAEVLRGISRLRDELAAAGRSARERALQLRL